MKSQVVFISTFLLVAGILCGKNAPLPRVGELGVGTAVITNNTKHKLKVSLQFKDQISKEEVMVENMIPSKVMGDEEVTFRKEGSLVGYKGGKFSIRIINEVMGIHTGDWEGEFGGEGIDILHTFEYRAVVQNPIKIMSTVDMEVVVKYDRDRMRIVIQSPESDKMRSK